MAGKVSSNPNEFLLPDLGEGLESADLIEWCVQVGQTVKEQDVLAKMETAKAVVDLYSPRGGTIAELHGKAGDTIKVGAPIVTFEGPAGGAKENGKPKNQQNRAEPDRASMKATEEQVHRAENHDKEEEREDAGTVVGSLGGADYSAVEGKVRAAPAVRRLARDLGVDIEQCRGTGIGGRVTMRDVESFASGARAQTAQTRRAPQPTSPPMRSPSTPSTQPKRQTFTVPAGQDQVRVPFKGVRRVIADRLSQSVHTAVHFTVMDEADITELDTLRRRLINATGEKLSYLPFVAAAVCKALREAEYARMNSTVDDEKQEIVTHKSVHLGIATDTDNGLMVPVIRDADQMGVIEIGRNIADRAARARDRTIAKEDLYGSTFTISNVGSLAGRFATPIINYPEVGILAVGRARDDVVVRNKMLGVGKVLPLSLSCDHRVVDGGTAALLLARIIELLQSPDTLIPA
jgi:pyruvate dehydrogenase E2 component (dihydrolipoamide acetyltransferase)